MTIIPSSVAALSHSSSNLATITVAALESAAPDFIITATGPVSFTAGGAATAHVTVAPENGFSSTVDLTASVSPPGQLQVSFNPQSITGGIGTATVGFSTQTPGTYTATITGTSGSTTHTATIQVTVTTPVPTPDFTISSSPASLAIQAGDSDTSTITVTPSNGFTGTVSLTATIPVIGLTATFNTSNITGGAGTSALSISVDSSVAAGNYTITVKGTSGTFVHNTYVTTTVSVTSNAAILGLQSTTLYAVVGGIIAATVVLGAVFALRARKSKVK